MNPKLAQGDWLMLTPLRASENGLSGTVRGDLVLLDPQYPSGTSFFAQVADALSGFFTFQQLHPFSDSRLMGENASIRRLIGIPGDTIYMDDFVLYIKPAGSVHFLTEFELAEISYDADIKKLPQGWDKNTAFSGDISELVLGPGEYFLLADDRVRGVDSRLWGTVPASRIKAKVFLCYWPLNNFSFL